ncbi:hypothetical protein EXIGLDRAFT_320301 [Exidia glandulosa HHB12029]|uniref:Uncharacterized protein n=1 Tax=Exidia glandulosa HHB12029 TaxID=1314781 RepID=A0A165Q524_EXIGL|nr:hypothetical protein EXIGLDRAFT_320301 [Exidia glandulosa HHB12029]
MPDLPRGRVGIGEPDMCVSARSTVVYSHIVSKYHSSCFGLRRGRPITVRCKSPYARTRGGTCRAPRSVRPELHRAIQTFAGGVDVWFARRAPRLYSVCSGYCYERVQAAQFIRLLGLAGESSSSPRVRYPWWFGIPGTQSTYVSLADVVQ